MEDARGPAVPSYIFRGHGSTVHALHFVPSSAYLASGDGEGWVVLWSLATKRPRAVWKAHEGGVMALKDWGGDRLMSHGRDHVLRVWQIRENALKGLSIQLPIDGASAASCKQPWLLHSMTANALNYCAFSHCNDPQYEVTAEESTEYAPQLIATPNGLDAGGVDIFHLPSQHRVCQLASTKDMETGMVMALSLFVQSSQQRLTLLSGYESGHIVVRQRISHEGDQWTWSVLQTIRPHTQPVLSIASTIDADFFLSSSADSIIAKFKVPLQKVDDATPMKVNSTKHAGQQDITIRDDGKIFATAGWDKRVRIYSLKTMKELAVLKWHQEGCYTVAFASVKARNVQNELSRQAASDIVIQTSVDALHKQRSLNVQSKHWLAAGGKDCKISLWDIY